MTNLSVKNMTFSVDFENAKIISLKINNKERLVNHCPIFKISMLNELGDRFYYTSEDFKFLNFENSVASYKNDFCTVSITSVTNNNDIEWFAKISCVATNRVVEYISLPLMVLPSLKQNTTNGGEILYPYNEGVLVDDIDLRENGIFKYQEPIYPSQGSYGMFPNMVFAQFVSYHFDDCGIYFGAHDISRSNKGIDFYKNCDGITIDFKFFTGCNFGQDFEMSYPLVMAQVENNWESAAEKYRSWFENNLPTGVVKIKDNDALPDWYEKSPLVISYPIRGRYDMDEMFTNDFYPYTNALPVVNEIKQKTSATILVLLMHWESTAPWAPPYVWPPYGDFDNFTKFKNSLNENGDLLGVYCSGFGYTLKSNLIQEYDKRNEYIEKELHMGMCRSEKDEIKSVICQGQRISYDICPTSTVGQKILNEAYSPLFSADLDYVQILDQNHGGGQYLCYAKNHNHPPVPGKWMTENMSKLLNQWNKKAPHTLFGCESAAAEPFIGNLLFSDNRYELNYRQGLPVSLYSYIYHEYLRNFMGNQVNCPFNGFEDTLNYRLAYSFVAGDSLTLVLDLDKTFLPNWGFKANDNANNREVTLTFIKNLTNFYNNGGKKYLYNARRTICKPIKCDTVSFSKWCDDNPIVLPRILTCAYEINGTKTQLLCNPFNENIVCEIDNKSITVPALNVITVNI